MSLWEIETAYQLAQLIADVGQTVVIRDVTTVAGATPYENPPMLKAPVVDGATLAGASAIGMRGALISGRVVSGDEFTIAGDLTVYTISGTVNASGNALAAVPFAPPLAQNAADGVAITFTFSADITIPALLTSFPARLINGTSIQETDRQLRFMAGSINFVPKTTMRVFADGDQYTIVTVKPASLSGTTYAYFCHLAR